MTPRADSWVPALTCLFPAARAPRRFLSDLERQLIAIAAWRRSAAWLPELLAQRPQLLDAPLFGHTLAAAVQGGEERAETPSPRTVAATPPMPAAPERPRRRSSRSNPMGDQELSAAGNPGPPRGAEGRSSVTVAAAPRKRAPLPGSNRTRVERSLLAAFSGGIPVTRAAQQKAASPALAPPPTAGERHLPTGVESGRLGQQLIRRLRFAHLTAEPGSAAPGGERPAAAPAAVDLAGQWALPLVGPSVSRAFLEAVLQPTLQGKAGPPQVPGEKSRPAAANLPWNGGSTPLPSLGSQPSAAKGGKGGGMEPHSPSADWHPPRETAPLLFSQRREALSTVASEARETVHTAGAAATNSGFPRAPFPAGQTDKVFDPTAAALPLTAAENTPGGQFFAALRRQRPSPEGFFDHGPTAVPGAAADDLEELTAKLQRILEEQARRHGIDV